MSEKQELLVSTVIVNYNSGNFLKEAVQSIIEQRGPETEIIVVDNASNDASLEGLDNLETQPEIIRNDKNLGFSKGCNLGAARAKGKYVLFLNPDCYLHKGALKELVNVLEQNSEASMVGPLLLNPDGSEQSGGRRDIPSPWKTFCMLLRLDLLMPEHPRFKSHNHAGRIVPKDVVAVDAVSGACMLVRSSALAKSGGFDEQYFLHFEDLELCLRLVRNHQSVLFVPSASCTHTKGQCSLGRPLFVEFHKHNSFVKFMNSSFLSYYPKFFLFLVSVLVYLRFAGICTKFLFSNRTKNRLADFWERI